MPISSLGLHALLLPLKAGRAGPPPDIQLSGCWHHIVKCFQQVSEVQQCVPELLTFSILSSIWIVRFAHFFVDLITLQLLLLLFVVLGIKPKVLLMLGKYSTAEL